MKIVKLIFLTLFVFSAKSTWANQESSLTADLLHCSARIETPLRAQSQVLGQISQTVLMEYAWPCAKGVLQGVWDASGGLVASAASCVWSPIQCARKARTAMKNAYEFFSNITQQVSQAMAALSSLPADAMAEVVCAIIGGIGTDVLLAVLTGGALSGKLAISMAKIALKLRQLAVLAKKVVKIPLRLLATLKPNELKRIERLVALGYENALYASLGTCQ